MQRQQCGGVDEIVVGICAEIAAAALDPSQAFAERSIRFARPTRVPSSTRPGCASASVDGGASPGCASVASHEKSTQTRPQFVHQNEDSTRATGTQARFRSGQRPGGRPLRRLIPRVGYYAEDTNAVKSGRHRHDSLRTAESPRRLEAIY